MEVLHMTWLETVSLERPTGARESLHAVKPERLADGRDTRVLKTY